MNISTTDLRKSAEDVRTWKARAVWLDGRATFLAQARHEARVCADDYEERTEAIRVLLKLTGDE